MSASHLGVVAAALACAFLSGCESSANVSVDKADSTVDREKAEALVTKAVRAQDVKPRSVRCPDDIPIKKGVKFSCTISGRDGTAAEAAGLVTDEKDNGTVYVTSPVANIGKLEGQMVTFLRKQVGDSAKVRCPELVTLKKGRRFTCRATAARDQTADIIATINDVTGAPKTIEAQATAAARGATRKGNITYPDRDAVTPKGDITFKVVPTG